MDEFDLLCDDLSEIFVELEKIMGTIHQSLEQDPNNQRNAEMLQSIGGVAKKILSHQRAFIETFGDEEIQEYVLPNIEDKMKNLSEALETERNL